MARAKKRTASTTAAAVLAALEEVERTAGTTDEDEPDPLNITRFLLCPEPGLQRASAVIGEAVQSGLRPRQESAFRAATYTPLTPPPGWLPPPV